MLMNKKVINDITVLDPLENLVGETVEALNNELETLTEEKSDGKYLLNLKNVSQIDSYALSILATFGNTLNESEGSLSFSNLQPFILSVFKMMRMDDIFEIYDDEDDLLKK